MRLGGSPTQALVTRTLGRPHTCAARVGSLSRNGMLPKRPFRREPPLIAIWGAQTSAVRLQLLLTGWHRRRRCALRCRRLCRSRGQLVLNGELSVP